MFDGHVRSVRVRVALGLAIVAALLAMFVLLAPSFHTLTPPGDSAPGAGVVEEPAGAGVDAAVTHPHTSSTSQVQSQERATRQLASLLRNGGLLAPDGFAMLDVDLSSAPLDGFSEFTLFGGVEDLFAGCESCPGLPTLDVPELQLAGMGYMGVPWGPFRGGSGHGGSASSASGFAGGSGGSSSLGGSSAPEWKGPPPVLGAPSPSDSSGDDDHGGDSTGNSNSDHPSNTHEYAGEIHSTLSTATDGTPQLPVQVPEPSTLFLAGLGLSGLAATRLNRKPR